MRAMMRVGSIDSSRVQTALITHRSGPAFGLKGGAVRPPHLQHRVERPRHDQIKGVSQEFGYVIGTRIPESSIVRNRSASPTVLEMTLV